MNLSLVQSIHISEVYEAKRWHNDPHYQAPMIISKDGQHIFAGDTVEILDHVSYSHAKVIKFMTEVHVKMMLQHIN